MWFKHRAPTKISNRRRVSDPLGINWYSLNSVAAALLIGGAIELPEV